MKRLAGCVAVALAIVLALAAVATANRIKHTGAIDGVADSKVSFAVSKRNGDLKGIRNLKFVGLPVNCSDGTASVVELTLPKIKVKGKRFSESLPVRGTGIADGTGKTSGRFSRGGKRAAGKVSVSYTLTSGVSCDSGEQSWTSRK
jgi:hypothetical protein